MPSGSRTPINFLFVRATKAYAPSIWERASINLDMVLPFFERATNWRIVSVSDVDWKMAPSFFNSCRKVRPLVRFPLCAIAKPPTVRSAKRG